MTGYMVVYTGSEKSIAKLLQKYNKQIFCT